MLNQFYLFGIKNAYIEVRSIRALTKENTGNNIVKIHNTTSYKNKTAQIELKIGPYWTPLSGKNMNK